MFKKDLTLSFSYSAGTLSIHKPHTDIEFSGIFNNIFDDTLGSLFCIGFCRFYTYTDHSHTLEFDELFKEVVGELSKHGKELGLSLRYPAIALENFLHKTRQSYTKNIEADFTYASEINLLDYIKRLHSKLRTLHRDGYVTRYDEAYIIPCCDKELDISLNYIKISDDKSSHSLKIKDIIKLTILEHRDIPKLDLQISFIKPDLNPDQIIEVLRGLNSLLEERMRVIDLQKMQAKNTLISFFSEGNNLKDLI